MKLRIHQWAWGAVALMAVSLPVWADSSASGDIGNLPDILEANLNLIASIIQTLAILTGLGLFISGIFQLKRYGEMRTMMSSQLSIAGPAMTMLAGVALLYFPLLVGTALVSFWGPTGAVDLPYSGDTAASWSQYVPAVLMLVRIIGLYSFMRGFVTAARLGSGHAQQGTVGKVASYILAGVLCVHIMGTIQLIESIFGMDFQI